MSHPPQYLQETSLIVRDLERSRNFYERVFGLPTVIEENGVVGLQLPGGAVLLLFHQGSLPPGSHLGDTHLRFGVPPGTLPDWDRHLSVQGVVIESRAEDGGSLLSLFFRDPDEHSLQVATDEA